MLCDTVSHASTCPICGSSQTKHWPASHSVFFVVQQVSLLSSERAFSPPYSLWFFSPSWLPLQGILYRGVGQDHLSASLFATLICFARAFVNGCTSPGVRCSSRHDDLPHASTSPVKNASTSPVPARPGLQSFASRSTLHNCRSEYSFSVTCAYEH